MKKFDTKELTVLGILTAIVIVLQTTIHIRFGMFSISTVLVPIVIGSALYGVFAGAWLGLVFGIAVLLSGDAAFFLGMTIPGTIFTVLAKGVLSGIVSALIYRKLEWKNPKAAVLCAAVAAPVVNTAAFILLVRIIFSRFAPEYGSIFTIIGMVVGLNFVVELIINVVLSSAMVFLIRYARRMH